MSGELQLAYTTALTTYAQIRTTTGTIWNGSSFESYVTANIANYEISLTEQGTASGYYIGNLPSLSAGTYYIVYFQKAGGSVAESDTKLGSEIVNWDGSQVIPLDTRLLTSDSTSRLERATKTITLGTVTTGATTTSIPTSSLDPAASVTDQYKGLILAFSKSTTTAALRGQKTDITASTSGGTLTVTALTTAPSNGDTFVIE